MMINMNVNPVQTAQPEQIAAGGETAGGGEFAQLMAAAASGDAPASESGGGEGLKGLMGVVPQATPQTDEKEAVPANNPLPEAEEEEMAKTGQSMLNQVPLLVANGVSQPEDALEGLLNEEAGLKPAEEKAPAVNEPVKTEKPAETSDDAEIPGGPELWYNLSAVFAAAPIETQPAEADDSQSDPIAPYEQDKPEAIADILEGMKQTDNKDIVPLLGALRDAATGQAKEQRKDVVARMPEIVERLDGSQENQLAKQVADVLRGYLCSLENVSGNSGEERKSTFGPTVPPPGTEFVYSPREGSVKTEPFTGAAPDQASPREPAAIPDGSMANPYPLPPIPDTMVEAVVDGKPVTFHEAVLDIIEKITSSDIPEGGKSFELQLKPEFLGKLTIHVTATENGLSALIRTEDLNVKIALSSQVQHLIEQLQENGVEVSNVDVVYTNMDQATKDSQQQSQARQQSDNNRFVTAASIPVKADEEYGLMASVHTDDLLNSVEFTA